jgi:hypothetical protein
MGVGPATLSLIAELVETGGSSYLDRLLETIPSCAGWGREDRHRAGRAFAARAGSHLVRSVTCAEGAVIGGGSSEHLLLGRDSEDRAAALSCERYN